MNQSNWIVKGLNDCFVNRKIIVHYSQFLSMYQLNWIANGLNDFLVNHKWIVHSTWLFSMNRSIWISKQSERIILWTAKESFLLVDSFYWIGQIGFQSSLNWTNHFVNCKRIVPSTRFFLVNRPNWFAKRPG